MNIRIKKTLHIITFSLEAIVGAIIFLAICGAVIGVVLDVTEIDFLAQGNLMVFLQRLIEIVIGIEFLRLLFSHTLDATVELIIIAVVRQVIVEHVPPTEVFISVLSLAILFVIRKYLFIKKMDIMPKNDSSYATSDNKVCEKDNVEILEQGDEPEIVM